MHKTVLKSTNVMNVGMMPSFLNDEYEKGWKLLSFQITYNQLNVIDGYLFIFKKRKKIGT